MNKLMIFLIIVTALFTTEKISASQIMELVKIIDNLKQKLMVNQNYSEIAKNIQNTVTALETQNEFNVQNEEDLILSNLNDAIVRLYKILKIVLPLKQIAINAQETKESDIIIQLKTLSQKILAKIQSDSNNNFYINIFDSSMKISQYAKNIESIVTDNLKIPHIDTLSESSSEQNEEQKDYICIEPKKKIKEIQEDKIAEAEAEYATVQYEKYLNQINYKGVDEIMQRREQRDQMYDNTQKK